MSFRYELRLSGDVGDGLILIGKILAEAAAIYDGYNAVQSQSYGEEARGDANRSEVIVSDKDIIYPKVERPDLLFCCSQIAHDRYIKDLKPDGVLIVDTSRVLDIAKFKGCCYGFPIFTTAIEQFGNDSLAVIIALGIVADITDILTPRAVDLALKARTPKGTEIIYERALKLGYQMAEQKHQKPELSSEA